MRRLVLALNAVATMAVADVADVAQKSVAVRAAWDGMFYGYANSTRLRSDSVLNPGNRVAGLAQRGAVAELRINFKMEEESETVRLTARPILSVAVTHNGFGAQHDSDAYFSQWQLRARVAEEWTVAAGREVLNWGPAQFRSPSSPFYFDNGRSDPLRELSGRDALKVSWTPDRQHSVSLLRLVGAGHDAPSPDALRTGWLAKFDRRGDNWAAALLTLKAPDLGAFHGAYGQIAASDALMLYGEIASSARAVALQSPTDPEQPFMLQKPSARSTTALIGANHTFEDGKSLIAEYLHDGQGYTPAAESAYFQRAVASPEVVLGLALGLAPRLLGRDYLHLIWQSNMLDERGYWRLMYTQSLSDGAREIAAYGETVLTRKIVAYGLAVLPQGNARQEFSTLVDSRITLGLKIALP